MPNSSFQWTVFGRNGTNFNFKCVKIFSQNKAQQTFCPLRAQRNAMRKKRRKSSNQNVANLTIFISLYDCLDCFISSFSSTQRCSSDLCTIIQANLPLLSCKTHTHLSYWRNRTCQLSAAKTRYFSKIIHFSFQD